MARLVGYLGALPAALRSSKAANTMRRYAPLSKRFVARCKERELPYLPTLPVVVAMYLLQITQTGRSYSTIKCVSPQRMRHFTPLPPVRLSRTRRWSPRFGATLCQACAICRSLLLSVQHSVCSLDMTTWHTFVLVISSGKIRTGRSFSI
ncbi:hypothetical protein COCSUDRAFT_45651 [Coccomyxa subellipsoidea C-169]|uniref:Uncharacterized protein n=1 Tax=Coccomyxa subellipsoidea (strain C-169) TaxID=574566 RepID=I0YI04_COCSC|nr:hypothetical protein COCSUDRAFT_45651 [Coccomyxa subellipsoidea C-169]EIE18023.1 hypothetical protein COCSUDRAFT_45651 [Coccomyxa subellipsoidea C-169]|eukprot:XP_005642567.1 hypothetical protein COCSUDRAFT_45651 [Coccomyxa subellipsoidea C-169]